MRFAPYLLLALLAACESGPSFSDVQAQDTIEAYEAFLVADPTTFYKPQIDVRLEELYFEKAKKEATIAGWDAYFAKYADGKHQKEALSLKEDAGFAAADLANTADAWKGFLAAFPEATKPHQTRAKGMVAVHEYGKLVVDEPVVEQVNLAEDPKGPLNGWGIRTRVTNGGDKTLTFVGMTVEFLGDDGKLLEKKDYPLVSSNWNTPATDAQTAPMKPGDARPWLWTVAIDGVPAEWHQKVRVYATDARE